jgi:hypothetical protein
MSKSNVEKVEDEEVESKVLSCIYGALIKGHDDMMQSGRHSNGSIKIQHVICLEDYHFNNAKIDVNMGFVNEPAMHIHRFLGVDNN